MASSETFHVVLRAGPATLRLSEGCIAEVNTVATAQAEVVRSLTFPSRIEDRSLFCLLFLGDPSLSACLLGLRSLFLSPLLFSFRVE